MANVTTTIRVDPETWIKFKKHCIDKNTRTSTELHKLIRQKLMEEKKNDKNKDKNRSA